MNDNATRPRTRPDVTVRQHIGMLDKETAGKLATFHLRHTFVDAKCLLQFHDRGPRGLNPPLIPYAPMTRSRVYTGTRENGSYNHHSQIAKFKGRYFFAWSNGIVNEEDAGQRALISSSADALTWSDPICVVGDKDDPVIAQNCIALHATEETLYLVAMEEETTKDAAVPGMRRINPDNQEVNVYASSDGVHWEKVFTFAETLRWIFEAPRLTVGGHLLCAAGTRKGGAAILRWPGSDICAHPEIIPIPQPHGALFLYGEGTWYQTDDGTIVMFQRDEGRSCRVWVTHSEDDGKTFSEPAISDIPDSMSRLYAGRLHDGRYYLSNNAFPALLNRHHLMLLLSDDGYLFNQVYLLIDDPTSQRLAGLLKADGYQYPCCFTDGDKLLVGYSVNKEDIECGVVDATKL